MSKQTNNDDPTTISIPLPAETFDNPDAVVQRRKRVSVALVTKVRVVARTKGGKELFDMLATIYPTWDGVCDVDSGEPLPHPKDDPMVFERLDYTQQMPWLIQDGLSFVPNAPRTA